MTPAGRAPAKAPAARILAHGLLAPALAGWITVRFGRDDTAARLAIAPAAFMASEWIRGWIFTGFPWNTIGTSQVPSSPLAGFAPVLGAYGVSLAAAGVAALLVALGRSLAMSPTRFTIFGVIAAMFAVGGALRTVTWTDPAGPPLTVALLQGDVPQGLKWRDDMRVATLLDYRRMIFDANAKVVVLPETALPEFFDRLPPDYVASLTDHARATGKEILLGTVERDATGPEDAYYNSVVRLGGSGPASYRKRHLVVFGEFIPPGFRWVYAFLKIPLGDMARGAARQPPIEAGGTRFAVAICYEDLFGEEMIDFLPDAQVLLNVSNMAWFGDSLAPEQHLQASQARALETGRWNRRHRGDRCARPRRVAAAWFHARYAGGERGASQGRDALRAFRQCALHPPRVRDAAPRVAARLSPVESSLYATPCRCRHSSSWS